ncbi:MAG: HD domain-containing protein [Lachnospiraceae bacterium]|jgi:putative nucleotidyltransferase with HDIG domain|nr:HD domain-containing protein [Lachnospiraceae bacterium]MCI8995885.1 HD domain-containing protein [Lachnospiraceae bacterium]MCI9133615.1 HD domain-containing protein [Lachnospiraceae bacterium]
MKESMDLILEEDIREEINHGVRVSNLAYRVAKRLGCYENICKELAVAGMLHDIGKLKVASYLYGRTEDTLGVEEMRYVRMHSRLGYEILMREDYSDFIIESVLYHHENYDGSGYPENLEAEDIPIGARILRVCDVYAALTSDRPYRKAFDEETAVELMIDEVKNFDMRVFLAFQQTIHQEELAHCWEMPDIEVKIEEETQ